MFSGCRVQGNFFFVTGGWAGKQKQGECCSARSGFDAALGDDANGFC